MSFKTLTIAEWNNLTANEKVANIKKGVIIDGTITSGSITIKNPIFLPPTTSTSAGLWGICVYGGQYEVNNFRSYSIAINNGALGFNENWKYLNLIGLQIYGKVLPQYPNDASTKTYIPKLVNGVWVYVEEN